MPGEPLLLVEGLRKRYRGAPAPAVDGVDLQLAAGGSLGLVGESGSGKSTTARLVNALERPDAGSVLVGGVDVHGRGRAGARRLAGARRVMQMVFQDPYSSLDPRMTVAQLLGEALAVHGVERSRAGQRTRATSLLEQVGLAAEHLDRHPHAFSGGQRQRIAIARVLAASPQLLICDEVVSSLDVSVQAQILNLLRDLRTELGLAVLFIAHDLAVVRYLCDDVAVMDTGRVVETGPTAAVFASPRHRTTRELLEVVPVPDPRAERARRQENRRARLA